MQRFLTSPILCLLTLYALTLSAAAASASAMPTPAQTQFDLREVSYHMEPAADGESLQIAMSLQPLFERDRVVVRIPWWQPGSYGYQNYHQRISDLYAVDQNEQRRDILALTPRAWEIDASGATSLEVRYTLVATNEAEEGATPAVHLRGPMTFLYTEDSKHLPHSLTVDLPKGWDFASGHRLDPSNPKIRRSPDYDVFVDCPIAMGDLERHSFESHGKTIEWVLFGREITPTQFDRDAWTAKLKAMSEVCYEIFGAYPFERYVYLFLANGIGGISGLEHLNSTSILVNYRGLRSGAMMEPLESVTAHEFFHLWNVKRIRPQQLGPFDYSTDVRTTDLWWLEGVTSYYNDIIVQRAQLRASGWFWQSQSSNFVNVHEAAGYAQKSPERASWTEWEPDRKTYISYYDQGQTLGLLLDLKIRLETQNRRSLDDVMAFLNRWVNYPDPGYKPDDLQRAIYAVSGWNPAQFFDRYVEGVVKPPLDEIGAEAGLKVVWIEKDSPYLGISFPDDDLTVNVREGAAASNAGLLTGDKLQSVAGVKVQTITEVRDALAKLVPDQEVSIKVRRGGSVRTFDVKVVQRGRFIFRLTPEENLSPLQQTILQGVLTGVPDAV